MKYGKEGALPDLLYKYFMMDDRRQDFGYGAARVTEWH